MGDCLLDRAYEQELCEYSKDAKPLTSTVGVLGIAMGWSALFVVLVDHWSHDDPVCGRIDFQNNVLQRWEEVFPACWITDNVDIDLACLNDFGECPKQFAGFQVHRQANELVMVEGACFKWLGL